MLQSLPRLRRTGQTCRAARHHISLAIIANFTQGRRATCLTGARKFIRATLAVALLNQHTHNLRDNITGALNDHTIANANIFASNLICIMQRRILHHDTADRYRLQLGDRRQRARAPDLNINIIELGGGLFGREFMRDSPAPGA